jgi:site-specific DNA-cytosine methylase
MLDTITEIRHAHLFCGLGGGAKGMNGAAPRVGNMRGKFRCIGGIDVDAPSIRDFTRAAGVQGTVLDLFDTEQYLAFHGHMPPPGWREAGTAEIHAAFHHERPHIVFLSAPCKGFSGLLSQTKSLTAKYQALNRLTLRGIWLLLEAYKDDPVELIVFENVPRIATRGRHLLDQIVALLRAYGYAVAETTHDCGELGGLGQSRKRFLLVARHMEKVPPFLYEPDKKPLKAVGEILGRMPLPGDPAGGPMHRIPSLQWKTWVRLAFVEAGSDWRSLNKLAVENGVLRDYLIVPEMHRGMLEVNAWEDPARTVTTKGRPNNGSGAVADPRFAQSEAWHDGHAYGVRGWEEPSSTITSKIAPGSGYGTVADPRTGEIETTHKNVFRVVEWQRPAGAVTSGHGPSSGGQAVGDPRLNWGAGAHEAKLHVTDWQDPHKAVTGARGPYSGAAAVADPRPAHREDYKQTKYRMTGFDEPAGAVIAASTTGNGAYAVSDPRPPGEFQKWRVTGWDEASITVIGGSTTGQGAVAVQDPRPGMAREAGDHYLSGGHYGVVPWDGTAGAVSASACHDNGPWSVQDPRPMPAPGQKLICRIRALDGTWHRPFTTLELAALQSLVDPEEMLELDGLSDQAWRERIGNAVPPLAALAIAEVMGETLLLAWAGETFRLSSKPIWVRNVAVAIALPGA